ncbi:MAG: M81 family metallopeptidase, partial [Acidobacteria bacterium]|nr:M81 family metallopeptidase [Acidobacteriota bacterium]
MGNREGRPRVVIGSIMHESNSFSSEPTTLDDFTFYEPDTWGSNSTEVAGMVGEIEGREFDVVRTLWANATPKGPVTAGTYEELTARLIAAIRASGQVDGMLLALHGAMVSEQFPQADEETVRRVRNALGPNVPLVVTHDFHANISPVTVELCDALVVYQQNPHLDTRERGARAARILMQTLRGEVRPTQAIVKPPLLWNIVFQNTYVEPLLGVTLASQALEQEPGILSASVVGGYQYADAEFMGPSVVVVTDNDPQRALGEARKLADRMWELRDQIVLRLPDASEAVKQAMGAENFPVALFELGDNVGGGSPGDETFILEQLLLQRAQGWVVVICDPAAVDAAKSAGVEGLFDRPVGGATSATMSKPVAVKGTVRSLHRGRYVETAVRHGGSRYWNMGHSAVIEVE